MSYCSRSKTPLVFIIMIALILPGILCGVAYGVQDEVEQETFEQVQAEIHRLTEEIRLLEESVRAQLIRVNEAEAALQDVTDQLEQTETELVESKSWLQEAYQHFGARVRSIHMNGRLSYLEILLGAESFGDLIIRVEYLSRILRQDTLIIETIKEEQHQIEQRKTEIAEHRQNVQVLRDEHQREHRALVAKQQEKEFSLASARERLAKLQTRLARKPVFGIIIGNCKRARPPSGLARASLVYEFEVEGRITRLLALFSELPTKVGPIRSAREHSAILALENDLAFVYASANWRVLEKINAWNFNDINALRTQKSGFWRDQSRWAPHNLYVNLAALSKETTTPSRTVVKPIYLGRSGEPVSVVSLEYGPNHRIRYVYDPGRKTYRRYLNGQIQRDTSGAIIRVRNIIIQYVPHTVDRWGTPRPNLVGEGRIDFHSQGYHFRGTWRKESLGGTTSFYFQDGQKISLPYGKTWIQIVRDS